MKRLGVPSRGAWGIGARASSAWTFCALASGALALGCGGSETGVRASAPSRPPPAPAAAPSDPLGPRPEPGPTPAYLPPVPVVYTATNGIRVWLLERHTLPLVSIVAAVPSGSGADPQNRPGLAFACAGMLDEGAGARGAIDFASAVDLLGASLGSSATMDGSFVSLVVLKQNLGPAFELLGDAVARPRFESRDWKRVQDLWVNDLRQRNTDPELVMQVVARAALYGKETPYGHPVGGYIAAAQKTTLDDVKRFHRDAWRPDRTTVVAVGDVTREELTPLLDKAFATWKAPAAPPPAPVSPPAPATPPPRFVLVDRADAPQSVIAAVRAGLPASSSDVAPLWRGNHALGGSFTSRLNQDLREEHGWTYGASSRLTVARGIGWTSMSAAVVTDHTGDAIRALLADVGQYVKSGITKEEAQKTRVQGRAELVERFQAGDSTAMRFAANAASGLPPEHERDMAARRDGATKAEIDQAVARYLDLSSAAVIAVGPRAKILPQLEGLGLPAPEIRDEEGNQKP